MSYMSECTLFIASRGSRIGLSEGIETTYEEDADTEEELYPAFIP
jgi:hypothetical protein